VSRPELTPRAAGLLARIRGPLADVVALGDEGAPVVAEVPELVASYGKVIVLEDAAPPPRIVIEIPPPRGIE
jgi:hypothetical protein